MVSALYNEGGRYMKLIRENSRLKFLPERDGAYSIEQLDSHLLVCGKGDLILPETKIVHPIYKITFEKGTVYTAEQLVSEVGITNFRDIGGYWTQDGRQVKYGCFYRSAPICFPNQEARQAFISLHIKNILDLRSPAETSIIPDESPESCHYIHCSAIPLDTDFQGNFDIEDLIRNGYLPQLMQYMVEMYRRLPFQNEAYRKLFDLLLTSDTPIVFHCTAGKDRTGFAAYLILKTLGVPDEYIMQDYMKSNIYREAENQKFLQQMPDFPEMKEFLSVKEEFLQASIQAIEDQYGDFLTYLNEEYGIGPEEICELKGRYLY